MLTEVCEGAFDVSVEQLLEILPEFLILSEIVLHPRTSIGSPLISLIVRNVENTSSADCGWSGKSQISDFEKHSHMRLKWDTLIVGQCENLIVVHH